MTKLKESFGAEGLPTKLDCQNHLRAKKQQSQSR